MNLLFVCKYNRFRSRVAEAIFLSLNKNKKTKVRSRGIMLDKLKPYVARSVISIMGKKGYKVGGKSKKISKRDILWSDLIIVVADNVKIRSRKVVYWKVSDISQSYFIGIRTRINKIEKRVKKLVLALNKKV